MQDTHLKEDFPKNNNNNNNNNIQQTNINEPLSLSVGQYSQMPYGSVEKPLNSDESREWLRCALGQTWNGNTCTGEAKKILLTDFNDVVKQFNVNGYDGKHDWRLPNIRELNSLRECSEGFDDKVSELIQTKDGLDPLPFQCIKGSKHPTLDTEAFPNTPLDHCFSTKTLYLNEANRVWDIHFKTGLIYESTFTEGYLRLVR